MRRQALELVKRTEDDLTDQELFAAQANDDFWFVSLCLDSLGRLPSEVSEILSCSEYTTLQAHNVVRRAMNDLSATFRDAGKGISDGK